MLGITIVGDTNHERRFVYDLDKETQDGKEGIVRSRTKIKNRFI